MTLVCAPGTAALKDVKECYCDELDSHIGKDDCMPPTVKPIVKPTLPPETTNGAGGEGGGGEQEQASLLPRRFNSILEQLSK